MKQLVVAMFAEEINCLRFTRADKTAECLKNCLQYRTENYISLSHAVITRENYLTFNVKYFSIKRKTTLI